MTSSEYDPASEGAETDFTRRMSYGNYLALDAILGAQHPLSEAHDEMLFIIQHQTTELWMRLAIHELSAARRSIAKDEVQPAMKMLARMSRIFEQLNGAWDVLRTMTPSEYTRFRSQLGQRDSPWRTAGDGNAQTLAALARRADLEGAKLEFVFHHAPRSPSFSRHPAGRHR